MLARFLFTRRLNFFTWLVDWFNIIFDIWIWYKNIMEIDSRHGIHITEKAGSY